MRGTTPPGVSFAPGQIHYALRDLVRARRIFNSSLDFKRCHAKIAEHIEEADYAIGNTQHAT